MIAAPYLWHRTISSSMPRGRTCITRHISDKKPLRRHKLAIEKVQNEKYKSRVAELNPDSKDINTDNPNIQDLLASLKLQYYDPQLEELRDSVEEELAEGEDGRLDFRMFDKARPLWGASSVSGKEGQWFKNLSSKDVLHDVKLSSIPKVKKPHHILHKSKPFDADAGSTENQNDQSEQIFIKDNSIDDKEKFYPKSSVSRVISDQNDPSVVHVHGLVDKSRSDATNDSLQPTELKSQAFDEILLEEIKNQIEMGIQAPYIEHVSKNENGQFALRDEEIFKEYEDKEIADVLNPVSQSYSTDTAAQEDNEMGAIFRDVMQAPSDTIDSLEYWSLYPKKVRRWLVYTMVPKGNYNLFGKWEPGAKYKILEDYQKSTKEFQIKEDSTLSKPSIFANDEYVQQMIEDQSSELDEFREEEDDGACEILDEETVWKQEEEEFLNDQKLIPQEFHGVYRFGIKSEEISEFHPRLKRLLSFKNASEREVTKFHFQRYIERYGKHPSDTGNSAVQIAIITLRIRNIQKSISKYGKNPYNEMRMMRMVKKRRGLLKHLKANDLNTYYTLLKDIKLKDQVELFKKKHVIPVKIDKLSKILNKKS